MEFNSKGIVKGLNEGTPPIPSLGIFIRYYLLDEVCMTLYYYITYSAWELKCDHFLNVGVNNVMTYYTIVPSISSPRSK